MKKVISYFYSKFIRIKEKLVIVYNKLGSKIMTPPIVLSLDLTIEKLLHAQNSISRYGDGEFAIMNGKDLLFQPFSKELHDRLHEVIKSSNENHLVCIPNIFNNLNWCTDRARRYWIRYLNLNQIKIYKLLNRNKLYCDSLVTRLYIDHKDKSKAEERFNKIKKIWTNRNVVIVEGKESRLGIGNDLFNNTLSIKRIICPAQDAFSEYHEILNSIKRQDSTDLILIALGPTATILSYDLYLNGYQALDIGHIDIEYEWFLQKVTDKVPVKNKYIGEVPGGSTVEELEDQQYRSQIIDMVI
ncbi:SP_1767 family glycosyltransferase [Rossellomorea aquimaris]|uniref:Glycosyltransferase family protein n=1 Tax=Rossellomorea aquimaris TaxID=189382 RepID=A0A366ELA9_9BACI|nr:SP_1767 family glycosyltransferase [Rossellomorea aquimaris]RBP03158.1 glycosyltransferase family protein [Rossellomorea aquimaris]